MTKSELMVRLAEVFAEKNGNQLLAKDVEYSVKVLVDTMTRSLARGQRIEIRGFGSFDLTHRPARIVIANRTHAKAEELARLFGIEAVPMSDLNGGFDIIINGTSGGLSGQLPAVSPEIFRGCRLAYDMVYGEAAQPFLAFARQSGAKQTADGLGMLVGQAASSCLLWRGVAPDVLPVVQYMREL